MTALDTFLGGLNVGQVGLLVLVLALVLWGIWWLTDYLVTWILVVYAIRVEARRWQQREDAQRRRQFAAAANVQGVR